ncbi:hypothetical protein GGF31_002420 [Allomyces arbusculus]|nr:hypothetical protein GGF31_002420 [Allomyces arbusculus]
MSDGRHALPFQLPGDHARAHPTLAAAMVVPGAWDPAAPLLPQWTSHAQRTSTPSTTNLLSVAEPMATTPPSWTHLAPAMMTVTPSPTRAPPPPPAAPPAKRRKPTPPRRAAPATVTSRIRPVISPPAAAPSPPIPPPPPVTDPSTTPAVAPAPVDDLRDDSPDAQLLHATGPLTSDQRKALRKLKNRLAASESRKRAREHLKQLENEVRDLKAKNADLERRLAEAEAELIKARQGGSAERDPLTAPTTKSVRASAPLDVDAVTTAVASRSTSPAGTPPMTIKSLGALFALMVMSAAWLLPAFPWVPLALRPTQSLPLGWILDNPAQGAVLGSSVQDLLTGLDWTGMPALASAWDGMDLDPAMPSPAATTPLAAAYPNADLVVATPVAAPYPNTQPAAVTPVAAQFDRLTVPSAVVEPAMSMSPVAPMFDGGMYLEPQPVPSQPLPQMQIQPAPSVASELAVTMNQVNFMPSDAMTIEPPVPSGTDAYPGLMATDPTLAMWMAMSGFVAPNDLHAPTPSPAALNQGVDPNAFASTLLPGSWAPTPAFSELAWAKGAFSSTK